MAGLARCQREAAEVTELMRQNVGRALERDGRLQELDARARRLRDMGEAFTRTTRGAQQQRRTRQRRWRLVAIGLAVTLLLLLLVVGLALWLARASPPSTPAPPAGTEPPGKLPGPGETLQ